MTDARYQAEVAAMWAAQLADIPLDAILAYLRSRGFVVGESWVWRGVDALPPGEPPRAEDDAPLADVEDNIVLTFPKKEIEIELEILPFEVGRE